MKIQNLIRKEIITLEAYRVEEESCRIKLDANENPFPFPVELRKKIASLIENLPFNRYPDPSAHELRVVLAKYLSTPESPVDSEMVMVGNGSDELIQILLIVFGGNPGNVLIPVPTFAMYKISAQILGQKPIEIPLEENFDLNPDKMLEKIYTDRPFLTFLSWPNNPTGNSFSRDKILKILEASQGMVVVDEAYFDFSKKTFLPLLPHYENLVILRTLSKIGAAGLRVGILISNKEVIGQLNKVRLPFNLNLFSQAAAKIIIEHREVIDSQIAQLIRERDKLYQFLKELPYLEPFPSDANFILVRARDDAHLLHQELIKRDILVRNLSKPGPLFNCLRIGIGTPEENVVLCEALKAIKT
jgi:histidinol-phosphate aminotransferase